MSEAIIAPATESVSIDAENLTESVSEPVADVKPKKRPHAGSEVRERCKELYLRGVRPTRIAAETGVSVAVINVWVNRHSWKALLNDSTRKQDATYKRVLSIQPQPESASSAAARETLAKVVHQASVALANIKPKSNLKEIRKVGKALEPLVRSAKIVHGWGSESVGGVVMSEVLGHEQEPQSSIAISADVQQVSCGPDTATGSVQKPAAIEPILQDPQVPTPQ